MNTVEKLGYKMRGIVAGTLMLLLTIGALAYFMPRESKFGSALACTKIREIRGQKI